MHTTYDPKADAAYVYIEYPIVDGGVKKTVSVNDDIHLDFDKEGKLVGVEVLSAKKNLNAKILRAAHTL